MTRNSTLLFAAGIMVLAVSDASAQRNIRHQTRNKHAVSTTALANVKPRTASVLENYAVERPSTTGVRVAAGDVNSDGSSFSNRRSVAKNESITIGGGRSEQIGANSLQSSRVGVQGMMGQQQSMFTLTSNLVQGNYIGTNVRMLNNKNPELHTNGVRSRGNDVLMEETTIVHEGIELSRSRQRIRR